MVTTTKPKKLSPFDYAKIIDKKGSPPIGLPDYDNFVINKIYSNNINSIIFANEINVECDKQYNFDFYYYFLDKRSHYGKWNKKEKENSLKKDTLNKIVLQCNCSQTKAQDIYDILENQNLLSAFIEEFDMGGRNK